MTKIPLNDPNIEPTSEILKNILEKSYYVYEELSSILTTEYGLVMNWIYYKDFKGWLCRVMYKKKTNFWLSAWKGYFKSTFYFLERHLEGLSKLEIADDSFTLKKEWGKMLPVVFDIRSKEQFLDLLKVVVYKKAAK